MPLVERFAKDGDDWIMVTMRADFRGQEWPLRNSLDGRASKHLIQSVFESTFLDSARRDWRRGAADTDLAFDE